MLAFLGKIYTNDLDWEKGRNSTGLALVPGMKQLKAMYVSRFQSGFATKSFFSPPLPQDFVTVKCLAEGHPSVNGDSWCG